MSAQPPVLRSPAAAALAPRLSYAQCWEDEKVLLDALEIGPDDDVLSIASAGDNALALALAGARSVTAIDLSVPQLSLLELKLAAAELGYQDYLALLGLQPGAGGDAPRALYAQVRGQLSPAARGYWDAHAALLEEGVLSAGRFERYLGAFRRFVLPLVHRRATVEALCALDSVEEQRRFYDDRWDTLAWRWLMRAFFSRPVMARAGRSPAHFAHVKGAVSSEFLRRARNGLIATPIRDNPYVQWMLLGRCPDLERGRRYLTRDGHRRLREARHRVKLVHAELEQFLPLADPGAFSAFNYSDLFEYLSAEQHAALLELTLRVARRGARLAYWNLLVPRWRPERLAGALERREARAGQLLQRDRAFVYGAFQLEVTC